MFEVPGGVGPDGVGDADFGPDDFESEVVFLLREGGGVTSVSFFIPKYHKYPSKHNFSGTHFSRIFFSKEPFELMI